jgi:hypothetical protein
LEVIFTLSIASSVTYRRMPRILARAQSNNPAGSLPGAKRRRRGVERAGRCGMSRESATALYQGTTLVVPITRKKEPGFSPCASSEPIHERAHALRAVGATQISPALQCWERSEKRTSPGGTTLRPLGLQE